MNKFISDNYKNTDDALLVKKWFNNYLCYNSPFLNQLILGPHVEAILTEAKRLEEKSKIK